jgi:hypothetical protein
MTDKIVRNDAQCNSHMTWATQSSSCFPAPRLCLTSNTITITFCHRNISCSTLPPELICDVPFIHGTVDDFWGESFDISRTINLESTDLADVLSEKDSLPTPEESHCEEGSTSRYCTAEGALRGRLGDVVQHVLLPRNKLCTPARIQLRKVSYLPTATCGPIYPAVDIHIIHW